VIFIESDEVCETRIATATASTGQTGSRCQDLNGVGVAPGPRADGRPSGRRPTRTSRWTSEKARNRRGAFSFRIRPRYQGQVLARGTAHGQGRTMTFASA